jgi:hypothetical protein
MGYKCKVRNGCKGVASFGPGTGPNKYTCLTCCRGIADRFPNSHPLYLPWQRIKLAEAKHHTTKYTHPASNTWLGVNVNGHTPEHIAEVKKKRTANTAKKREDPDVKEKSNKCTNAFKKSDAGK